MLGATTRGRVRNQLERQVAWPNVVNMLQVPPMSTQETKAILEFLHQTHAFHGAVDDQSVSRTWLSANGRPGDIVQVAQRIY